ncbi:MAG: ZIP family metal transporter [Elusimicrobia bacterium]|nr:ZIP family metal transporter [Candidatus Obscuribacterium magneticum]
MTLLTIIAATLIVGLVSLVGIIFVTLKLDIKKITFYLVSLASGTMLGGAFLDLIPEALSFNSPYTLSWVSGGVFLFFIFEKFLIWRHCHHHHHPLDHGRPTAASMILAGDAIHNFIDGIIIATSFNAGFMIGISVTLAIMLHEIPQELGDFGVLVHSGFTVKKALVANFLTAMTALAGAVITHLSLGLAPHLQMVLLPIAAGGFLYVALADLIPQLHDYVETRQTFAQISLFSFGFGLMWLLTFMER